MTPSSTRSATRSVSRRKAAKTRMFVALALGAAVVIGAAVALVVIKPWASGTGRSAQAVQYLGVYEPDAPHTYADVNQFAQAIGRQPNLVSYYSSWLEPFQNSFAASAAKHGAITVVQIDPKNVPLSKIATGMYDGYLRSYAQEVKTFGAQVVLSFGHEMNGRWYSWGNQHTSAKVFVAAWRHIVTTFRGVGAKNVTWMWTVNVINTSIPIPDPTPWWPGSSYVNWVGIDGYYYQSSQNFAQIFGPTIVAVLKLTKDPMLIAETGAAPATDQPAKIDDLFAGVRSYGLIGFMWFDENTQGRVWRLTDPKAFVTFRQDTKSFVRVPGSAAGTPTHLSGERALSQALGRRP